MAAAPSRTWNGSDVVDHPRMVAWLNELETRAYSGGLLYSSTYGVGDGSTDDWGANSVGPGLQQMFYDAAHSGKKVVFDASHSVSRSLVMGVDPLALPTAASHANASSGAQVDGGIVEFLPGCVLKNTAAKRWQPVLLVASFDNVLFNPNVQGSSTNNTGTGIQMGGGTVADGVNMTYNATSTTVSALAASYDSQTVTISNAAAFPNVPGFLVAVDDNVNYEVMQVVAGFGTGASRTNEAWTLTRGYSKSGGSAPYSFSSGSTVTLIGFPTIHHCEVFSPRCANLFQGISFGINEVDTISGAGAPTVGGKSTGDCSVYGGYFSNCVRGLAFQGFVNFAYSPIMFSCGLIPPAGAGVASGVYGAAIDVAPCYSDDFLGTSASPSRPDAKACVYSPTIAVNWCCGIRVRNGLGSLVDSPWLENGDVAANMGSMVVVGSTPNVGGDKRTTRVSSFKLQGRPHFQYINAVPTFQPNGGDGASNVAFIEVRGGRGSNWFDLCKISNSGSMPNAYVYFASTSDSDCVNNWFEGFVLTPGSSTTGYITNALAVKQNASSSATWKINRLPNEAVAGTWDGKLGRTSDEIRSVTAAFAATDASRTVLGDTTGGAYSVTLPTAIGRKGTEFVVKRTSASANNLTVATTSSQTIDGATTYGLSAQYKYVRVVSDGANWQIVANN